MRLSHMRSLVTTAWRERFRWSGFAKKSERGDLGGGDEAEVCVVFEENMCVVRYKRVCREKDNGRGEVGSWSMKNYRNRRHSVPLCACEWSTRLVHTSPSYPPSFLCFCCVAGIFLLLSLCCSFFLAFVLSSCFALIV